MMINQKILSIPPYISTAWDNVVSLHMKGGHLMVSLKDGEVIAIPNLSGEQIEQIFSFHSKFLESDFSRQSVTHTASKKGMLPFHFAIGTPESFASVLQHQPEQKNAPDLPPEILAKITAITKIIAPDDSQHFPKPEPHCNCMHCQFARALQKGSEGEKEVLESTLLIEEEISLQDLSFSQWEITQAGEKLYTVINRLDSQEKYSVYLGHPIGCTCGGQNCEHIVAVLKS